MENAEKFFETYCDFVTKVTSNPSLKIEDLKTIIKKEVDVKEWLMKM